MKHFLPMLAMNLCVGIAPALAFEAPASWAPVDDDTLAHATGKYLDQNMISGFQLEMISHWQTPSGANLYAAGAVSVQRNGSDLSVTANTSSSITPGQGDPSAKGLQVPRGGNLLRINGVGQITQVAGNSNAVTNQTLIDFQPKTGGGGGGASNPGSKTTLGTMSAAVSIGANGLNLALEAPFGTVQQNIASGAGSLNRIMQVVQVAGDQQQVINSLQLHLQTNPVTADLLRQIGVQQAVSSTLGIRR